MESTAQKIATVELKNNTLFVSGAIEFDNVVVLSQQGAALINNSQEKKEIKVDLGALKQSDSSGLALLTGWVRLSQEQNKTMIFMNMPSFMKDILNVCGLEGVLSVLWEN
jgi:anti-anti-sigma factor